MLHGSVYRYPQFAPTSKLGNQDRLIERVGDTLNLDVSHLKEILNSNTSRSIRSADKESQINIAVHLGRNTSYERFVNNSGIQVISYQNVMPNFFSVIVPWKSTPVNASKHCQGDCGADTILLKTTNISQNESSVFPKYVKSHSQLLESLPFLKTNNITENFNMSQFKQSRAQYSAATKVFLYQHEMGGYAMRDCFKSATKKAGLNLLAVPLNQAFRQEWDFVPENKRSKFQALYGSLAFGVCENIKRPCLYATMMTHPLDRILQVYFQCRQNASQNLCNFYRSSNITQGDILSFIKVTGNSYFKKLIYHSKQCRLIGEDEICIQDGKASFILSQSERKAYLQNVLKNMDKWFAVIGLIEHYKESLKLFEYVFGEKYTECATYMSVFHQNNYHPSVPVNSTTTFKGTSRKDRVAKRVLKSDIMALRTKLLTDSRVVQWLYADLAIYDKATAIFSKQWAVYRKLHNVSTSVKIVPKLTNGSSNTVGAVQNTTLKRKLLDILLLEKTYPTSSKNKAKRSLSNFHTQPYSIRKKLRESKHKKRKKMMTVTAETTRNVTAVRVLNEPVRKTESERVKSHTHGSHHSNITPSHVVEQGRSNVRTNKAKHKKGKHQIIP